MTETESQTEAIVFLSDPSTHGGMPVERISTHGAHVFLAGDLAYKLKRAVKLPFMDFSTIENRHAVLDAELRINRTTAPGIYIEVRPICRAEGGALGFGGDGTVLDWVLVMRRFDQDDLLDRMACRGALDAPIMGALAEEIAAMHRRAPVISRPEGEVFTKTALDNIPALRDAPVDQGLVDKLEGLLQAGCAEHKRYLDNRAAGGFVRRCHGDLHLRNIVLLDGRPAPFDALEFDDGLATGDVFYDLAFLLMDIDHRGLRWLANGVLNRYVGLTDDIEGVRALPLFLAVRAAIRAKVTVISAAVSGGDRSSLLRDASSYLELAVGYLPSRAPVLAAIGGLSGTGKSRVAAALAPKLGQCPGALVFRSDVFRKRLHGVEETVRLPPEAYTEQATGRVYSALLDAAGRCVRARHPAIIDAVFSKPAERAAVEDLAKRHGVKFIGLWLETGLEVRKARVAARSKDASDADTAIVERQETYQVGQVTWHTVDANGSIERTRNQVAAILRRLDR
ncbi:MAG: AAA family ATPase [Rhodospirillaceae bacterium]|nr:AAA family ATPase [Rhodospirillaceae bacterium]